jgi:hypothetical protein
VSDNYITLGLGEQGWSFLLFGLETQAPPNLNENYITLGLGDVTLAHFLLFGMGVGVAPPPPVAAGSGDGRRWHALLARRLLQHKQPAEEIPVSPTIAEVRALVAAAQARARLAVIRPVRPIVTDLDLATILPPAAEFRPATRRAPSSELEDFLALLEALDEELD